MTGMRSKTAAPSTEPSSPVTGVHTPGTWRAHKDGPNPWWRVHTRREVAELQGDQAIVWNDPKHPARTFTEMAHLVMTAPGETGLD